MDLTSEDETQEVETIDRSSAEGFGEGSGTDSVSERLSSIATRKQGCSKFSINKILDDETIEHLYSTDYFYKVLQLAQLSNEINNSQ